MLLAVAPGMRAYFMIREAPIEVLGAFAPGDLGLVALGSLLVGLRRGDGWSGRLAWIVAGAMMYAAAYTVATAALRISHALGACLMVPAAGASLIAASHLTHHAPAERLPTGPVA
jgi:hypothetical protein